MSFSNFDFHRHISETLNRLGYATPTPIQHKAIAPILDGRDLLGLAQTGTGKTAAFVLPILQRLITKPSPRTVQTLIVAPTRELAEQTNAYIGKFASGLSVRHCVLYGGVSKEAQVRALRGGAAIVVACPGRLLDLAHDGAIDLSAVATLVLDEADQMLDQGFLPDIRRIIKLLPAKRQNLVFSATMPREVRSLVDGILVDPVEVTASHTSPVAGISHTFYKVDTQGKNLLLTSILKEPHVNTAIVFTRTKHKAKNLARQLESQGFRATSIQGNLSQQQRQRALDGFRSGIYDILVATDIAARGIDVAGISHVINYDMPGTAEAYTHRTGRTGRADRSGEALTFATVDDNKMIEDLRWLLQDRFVYGDAGTPAGGQAAVLENSGPVKPSAPRQMTRRKANGRRSSGRSRKAAFDFGI